MRERWVRIVAALTGALVVLLAASFAWVQTPRAPAEAAATEAAKPPAALVEAGRAIYEEQGCAMCHAIGGQGNPRAPLDGVGSRHDAAALRDWILATGEAGAKLPARTARMKQDYRALAAQELDALVAYLQSPGGQAPAAKREN